MTPPVFLAVDIDGTLINSDKAIMEFTRSEIQRVTDEYGARLFIVTARGPESTAVIENRLGVSGSYATYGGALVWAREQDGSFTVLQETPLPDAVVRGALAAVSDAVHVGVYSRDRWYVNELNYWGLREARNTAIWPEVRRIDDALVDAIGSVFKIMFRGDEDDLAALERRLDALGDQAYVHNSGRVLEIISSDAVKLPAVRRLCIHFGGSLDDVIAFGDSSADVEMLENAGVGVLMGNARASLEVAPHVERTLSNDEDGIGVILRKYYPTSAPFAP